MESFRTSLENNHGTTAQRSCSPNIDSVNTPLVAECWCHTQVRLTKMRYLWTISNFSFCREDTGEILKSSSFSSGPNDKLKWCLRINPKGLDEDSREYMSLYLLLINSGTNKEARAKFRFSILNSRREETKAMESQRAYRFVQGKDWGFKKFIRRDVLMEECNGLLPNDQLTVLCEVSVVGETLSESGQLKNQSISIPPCNLQEDLGNLLRNQLFTDVTLVVVSRPTRGGFSSRLSARTKKEVAASSSSADYPSAASASAGAKGVGESGLSSQQYQSITATMRADEEAAAGEDRAAFAYDNEFDFQYGDDESLCTEEAIGALSLTGGRAGSGGVADAFSRSLDARTSSDESEAESNVSLSEAIWEVDSLLPHSPTPEATNTSPAKSSPGSGCEQKRETGELQAGTTRSRSGKLAPSRSSTRAQDQRGRIGSSCSDSQLDAGGVQKVSSPVSIAQPTKSKPPKVPSSSSAQSSAVTTAPDRKVDPDDEDDEAEGQEDDALRANGTAAATTQPNTTDCTSSTDTQNPAPLTQAAACTSSSDNAKQTRESPTSQSFPTEAAAASSRTARNSSSSANVNGNPSHSSNNNSNNNSNNEATPAVAPDEQPTVLRQFHAHKAILAARSPVFAAMFEHGMEESRENRVEISDIDPEPLAEVLKYIYTAQVDSLHRLAPELLAAADKYQLDRLKTMCEDALAESLCVENACDTLGLADRHNAEQLKLHTLDFIMLHPAEVCDTEGFEELSKHQPRLLNECFRSLASQHLPLRCSSRKRPRPS